MGKEINIDEMRKIQLEILDKIHCFCGAYGIRYSLCGGTLLGAVRHKGYIPWDDDIDILMPRPDYETFLSEYRDEEGIVTLQHYKNDITFPLRWARAIDTRTKLVSTNNVSGVFVDIFPVDGLAGEIEAEECARKLLKLRNMLAGATKFHGEAVHSSPIILRIKYYIKKLIYPSRNDILKQYDDLFNSNPFETSKFAGAIVSRFGAKELMDASVFKSYIQLPFEGKKYNCIKDYDIYLKKLYGNYMQLPPEEKRKTHHKFKVYWK